MNWSSLAAVRVGILSDTHGQVCPEVLEVIAGCDVAVHGGDIGSARVLRSLQEATGSVHAVCGNNDVPGLWAGDELEVLRSLPRITSYNVCYTKLLRQQQEDKDEAADEKDANENAEGEKPGRSAQPAADAMTRKAVNDAVAYIRGLAEQRGRNADWAERAVRDADSITAEKALELGVIDFIARDMSDLLTQANGRRVEVNGAEVELETAGLTIEQMEPDWRNELLGVITSPTIAYLLLLIGVYGLILEGYNPGRITSYNVCYTKLLRSGCSRSRTRWRRPGRPTKRREATASAWPARWRCSASPSCC